MPAKGLCCEALQAMMDRLNHRFQIGVGEISGYVSADETGITFDDGWSSEKIEFCFCPFCGTGLPYKP